MSGKKLSILLFTLLLVILPIVTFTLPKKEFSETENRSLQEFPKLSFDTLANRKFMQGFENFFSDHFVFRDQFVTLKSKSEYLTGKRENNGIFIGTDQLLEKVEQPNSEVVNKNIKAINKFIEQNKVPTSLMLVPTAVEILKDKLPLNASTWDQKAFINDVYKQVKGASNIDIYSLLSSKKNEYIYYRTDHHWTTLGAYYGYKALASSLGFEPIDLNQFNIEHASNDFNGTLYSKSGFRDIMPDVLDIYTAKQGAKVESLMVNRIAEMKTYDSLYFTDYLSKKDKYSVFLGPNEAHIKIKSNATSGKKLLVFKDSFAHSLIPFLANHYSEIDVLDLRYMNTSYKQFVNVADYDHVLILYNMGTFPTDKNIGKLGS